MRRPACVGSSVRSTARSRRSSNAVLALKHRLAKRASAKSICTGKVRPLPPARASPAQVANEAAYCVHPAPIGSGPCRVGGRVRAVEALDTKLMAIDLESTLFAQRVQTIQRERRADGPLTLLRLAC